MSVAEHAYRAAEVVQVPAQSVEGDDYGAEFNASRLLVALDALVGGGDDQRHVAFGRSKTDGIPVDQDETAVHSHDVARVRLAVSDDHVRSDPARRVD